MLARRLLGLDPEAQAVLFDFYQATLEALTARARKEGALDEGIVDVRAHSVTLAGPPRTLHKVRWRLRGLACALGGLCTL
jgi:hypothetical protein